MPELVVRPESGARASGWVGTLPSEPVWTLEPAWAPEPAWVPEQALAEEPMPVPGPASLPDFRNRDLR